MTEETKLYVVQTQKRDSGKKISSPHKQTIHSAHSSNSSHPKHSVHSNHITRKSTSFDDPASKFDSTNQQAANLSGFHSHSGQPSSDDQLPAQGKRKKPPAYSTSSYFDGSLLQLIGWSLLGSLVTLLTLGICFPMAFCMIYSWEAKHTVIDGHRLLFNGTSMQFFGNWIIWWLLTVFTLGIYGFWLPIKVKQWKTMHTVFAD